MTVRAQHGHHRLLCPTCRKVLAQCRCIGPKPDRTASEPCDECKRRLANGTLPNESVDRLPPAA